jgi:uncharacterized protein (TIGR04562 family)
MLSFLSAFMDLIQNFEFSWPSVSVVIEGGSILDLPRLDIKTIGEATEFIQAYGFDVNNQDDLALVWKFFNEAVQFIEKSLASPDYPKVPEHLRSEKAINDIRRLFVLASEKKQTEDQIYACAILRIMHVMIHLTYDPRLKFFHAMQTQVLNRLDKYIYVDPSNGATYLGRQEDGQRIKLLFFKKKERKDPNRELIKLLHKADSAVEEIYDRVGLRLVTETKLDAIRAVRILLEKNIISLPNIRPGRSRNRLIDLKRLQFELDRISTHLKKTPERAPYIDRMIKRLEKRIGYGRIGRSFLNPHSSEHYRAIQFTCRELVKVRNPQHRIYTQLSSQVASISGGSQLLIELFPTVPPAFDFGFFPYEVQIMDVKAYADSIFGKSNHEEYRRKQLNAARSRVFPVRS